MKTDKIIEGVYTVVPVSGGEEMPGFQYRWTGDYSDARNEAFEHAAKLKAAGLGVRVYHEATHLIYEVVEPVPTTEDLIKQLEKLANIAETSDRWADDERLMPAAGVADILYDVIEVLEFFDE